MGLEMTAILDRARAAGNTLNLADARRLNTLTKQFRNIFTQGGDVRGSAGAKSLAQIGGDIKRSIRRNLSGNDKVRFDQLNKRISNSIDIRDKARRLADRPVAPVDINVRGITAGFTPSQLLTRGARAGSGPLTALSGIAGGQLPEFLGSQ